MTEMELGEPPVLAELPELDDDGAGAAAGLVEVATGPATSFSSVSVPLVDPAAGEDTAGADAAGGDPPLTAAAAPQVEGSWMTAGWAV